MSQFNNRAKPSCSHGLGGKLKKSEAAQNQGDSSFVRNSSAVDFGSIAVSSLGSRSGGKGQANSGNSHGSQYLWRDVDRHIL